MTDEKDLGADAAAVESAGSIASAAAPHVAHTPGPWSIARNAEQAEWWWGATHIARQCVVVSADYRPVCATNDDGVLTVQDIANAHLIAAAPEMYEACKTALMSLRHVCTELGLEHCHRCKVAAAIAKAEGRE